MSKLALCLPTELGVEAALVVSEPLDRIEAELESIWKGNDPKPFDTVEDCDWVDMARILRTLVMEDGGGALFDFFA